MQKKFSETSRNHTHTPIALSLFGIVFLCALLNWSCSSIIQPVSLKGEEADLALLTGEWKGEYYSKALGRGGSIEFKLIAGENSASGEVIMIPRGSQMPFQPISQTGEPRPAARSLEVLKINFVQISRGRVSGKLDPYWDPDNKVTLLTFFDGVLRGDIIEGTFRSRREESGFFYHGQWKVTRISK
ncbi:MAG: hypothetical protein JSV46_08760 [Candidatus Aminicenantes bacterium]|nr:MAG: hypothetical protein JSV46_08760 [Candidatus Aminicenantes bacterium]